MNQPYDLLVIGTGTAATTAAMRVRAAGWRVAIVDHRPFGGTCALRGCDPKKMLNAGAAARHAVRRMREHGLAGDVRLEWPPLAAFARAFTDPVPENKAQRFADKGIDAFHGRARFTGRDTLEIDGREVTARHVLLASGAEPVKLGIPGEEHLIDNEGFFALPTLPRRIVLVGGGYIAAEFSHIAANAGAEVTILHRGRSMLKPFEPELVDWLMASFSAFGIDVRTGTEVTAIEKSGDTFTVKASADGESRTFEADLVVHAAGRKPDFGPLALEAAGIAIEKGRLQLNEFLQSVSNPAVYAAGDAARSGPPLTPVASHDAQVVAANLLEGNHRKPDYRGVPSVAFTIPPLAAVGLGEEEARERGLKFKVNCKNASDWFTARQQNEPVYGFKLLVEEGSERILGAHLVGPHADEVINVLAFAIRHGHTAEDIRNTMFAYPTGASDLSHML